MSQWTNSQIQQALFILKKYPATQYRDALREISRVLKKDVTRHSLYRAFLRRDLEVPLHYCKKEALGPTRSESSKGHTSPMMQRLTQLMKRHPISFQELCDKLDMSPSRTRQLLDDARMQGMQLRVENDHVGMAPTYVEDDRVKEVGIAPVVGERQKVAVISDTHLGSKYCLRDQLREFIHYAYDQGVREILHPGDVLDGMYKHGIFEVSHTGLDAQAQDLLEVLPKLPGLNYRCITGNHDFTFTESIGVDVGEYLSRYFRDNGRKDIHFYGNRGAFLRIKGALVHLWHPRSGVSYARSYALQKHIEKYSSGEKPNILLAGHWHVYCHVYERGVHGIACPTFQGGGSAFSKSLGGAPAIGGLLLSWDLTEHGTIRSFVIEKRSYFEVEQPHRVSESDAIPVDR